MKTALVILLLGILFIAASTIEATAETKSLTLGVSCIVPKRLEISSTPERLERIIEKEKAELPILNTYASKIQSQQIKNDQNQLTITYTIIDR